MPHLAKENFSERLNMLFHCTGPREAPLYAKGGVSTFFHKPLYGKAGERLPADCVFFGCPFDAGSTFRSGLRFALKKIREVLQMLLTPDCSNDNASWMDNRNFVKMKIFDLITAVGQIYVFAKVVWNTSKKLEAIGADHTLSWSFLAAARESQFRSKLSQGRRLHRLRGISGGPELQQKSDEEGYRTITIDEFNQIGPKDAAVIVKERIETLPASSSSTTT